ncbi:MAG: hypothetical protein WCX61_05555, partial [Candidatus Peribacteraceae bacterium]
MSPVAAKAKTIGKVVHYFDKISVAIIELTAPLKVNDTVIFRRGDQECEQEVTSLEVEHQSVAKAKKGDVIGMKVDLPVKEGTAVL